MIHDGITLVCSERVNGNADEVQSWNIGGKLDNPVHDGTADVLDCLRVGDEAFRKHLCSEVREIISQKLKQGGGRGEECV